MVTSRLEAAHNSSTAQTYQLYIELLLLRSYPTKDLVDFLFLFTMDSSRIGIMIAIESDIRQVPFPERPKQSVRHGSVVNQDDIEMTVTNIPNPVPSPSHRNDAIKDTRATSPVGTTNGQQPGSVSEHIQTLWRPFKNRYRVLAACLTALANGMNDAAPGALIASIETYGLS